MQGLHRRPRLDAQLVCESVPCVAEDGERISRPARLEQREHQLFAQRFAQGLLGDEPFECRHALGTAPFVEICGHSHLARFEVQLGQAAPLALHEFLVLEIGVGSPAPKRKRFVEELAPLRRVGLTRGDHEALESAGVDLLRVDLEDVAGRAGDDHLWPEHLTQLRDVIV